VTAAPPARPHVPDDGGMPWSVAAPAKIVPRGTPRERTSPASAGVPVNDR
jgi:hypothetical protein